MKEMIKYAVIGVLVIAIIAGVFASEPTTLQKACRNAFYDDYGERIAKLDMSGEPLKVCQTHPYCCPILTGVGAEGWQG